MRAVEDGWCPGDARAGSVGSVVVGLADARSQTNRLTLEAPARTQSSPDEHIKEV